MVVSYLLLCRIGGKRFLVFVREHGSSDGVDVATMEGSAYTFDAHDL